MILALRRMLVGVTLSMLLAGSAQAIESLPDFTQLVERHGAAVVNISARQPQSRGQPRLPFPLPGIEDDDPVFEFFRRILPQLPPGSLPRPEDDSLGSGFIIDADGYILTNAHVVEDAEEIRVKLADRREFRATLVGADARSDVALLKIESKGLPHVVFGDPNALKVGEWVLAIGSPFGFEQSATAGIVSATGRSLPEENFVPFIQTDVAINPGNSGGPLFNLKGEVVGMNSQIYSRTGGYMGLSFAIPIDVAMNVQQQLRSHGRVQRGRIGVAVQEVTRDLADSFGLQAPAGALVSGVEPDGPAARAGLQQGDVILRFNGEAVERSAELPRMVAAVRPGERAKLTIHRNGVIRELSVRVGEWADEGEAPGGEEPEPEEAPNPLGLVVVEPSEAQRRERGIEHGLLVERVLRDVAGGDIRAGDVLLAIVIGGRQTRLDTLADFERKVLPLSRGQQVTLLVQRENSSFYQTLRAE
ncbi:DegQ family serine endoprotease [Thauera phenolivorans]|uniref:DegQ family serine endoprotease n=1 Tax=Thauera phenolivorans TaxID=1792543 RepID=UPI00083B0E55|nr:DegQ family serine endoprotease [Thauera phenolivorans]